MAQTQLNRVYVQTIDSTGTTDPTLSLGVKSLTTTVKIGGIGTGGNSINVSSTGINMSGPLNALGQTNLQNTSILNVGITGQTTLQNTSINGTLNVAGLATLINVSTTSLSVLNNVSVGGNVSVSGNLYVSSNMILPTLTVGSNAILENASIMGTLKATKDLTTLKNVSINETLDVIGLTTLNGLTVNQGTNFYNSVGISNNALTFSGSGGINVAGTGQTTLQNTSILQGLTVSGNTSLSNTVITGTTDINRTGSATTTIGNSGSMTVVAGNASLRNVSAQALTVGPLWAGATTLSDGATVTGTTTQLNSTTTTVGGTLGVTGLATLSGGATVTGTTTNLNSTSTMIGGTLGVTGRTTLANVSCTSTGINKSIITSSDFLSNPVCVIAPQQGSEQGTLELGSKYGLVNVAYGQGTAITDGGFSFRETNSDGNNGTILMYLQNTPENTSNSNTTSSLPNTAPFLYVETGNTIVLSGGVYTFNTQSNSSFGRLYTNIHLFSGESYKLTIIVGSTTSDTRIYFDNGVTPILGDLGSISNTTRKTYIQYFTPTTTAQLLLYVVGDGSNRLRSINYTHFSVEKVFNTTVYKPTSISSLDLTNSLSTNNIITRNSGYLAIGNESGQGDIYIGQRMKQKNIEIAKHKEGGNIWFSSDSNYTLFSGECEIANRIYIQGPAFASGTNTLSQGSGCVKSGTIFTVTSLNPTIIVAGNTVSGNEYIVGMDVTTSVSGSYFNLQTTTGVNLATSIQSVANENKSYRLKITSDSATTIKIVFDNRIPVGSTINITYLYVVNYSKRIVKTLGDTSQQITFGSIVGSPGLVNVNYNTGTIDSITSLSTSFNKKYNAPMTIQHCYSLLYPSEGIYSSQYFEIIVSGSNQSGNSYSYKGYFMTSARNIPTITTLAGSIVAVTFSIDDNGTVAVYVNAPGGTSQTFITTLIGYPTVSITGANVGWGVVVI